ncbi:hypothetical protein MMC07_002226 [Pseudocyphellaria aurata]|nr:hypothetical protein [Pseudocyphellaria aurata]
MSASPRSNPSSLFPVYLIPSLPFRRRNRNGHHSISFDKPAASSKESSLLSCDATPGAPTAPTAALPTDSYLRGHVSRLRCARCAADLGLSSQIISKGFTGRHGRAYLVSPTPPSFSASAGRTIASSLPNTHTHAAVPRQLVTGAHTVSDVSCAFCGAVVGWKYDGAEEESQRYKVGKFILETKRICTDSCWESGRWEEIVSLPSLPSPTPHPPSSQQQQLQAQPAPAAGGGGGGAIRGGTFSVARGIFMDDDEDEDDDDANFNNDPRLSDPQSSSSSSTSTSHPHQSFPTTPTALSKSHQDQEDPIIEFDSQDEDECEDLFAGVWSPALALKRRQAKNFGGARGKLKGIAAGAAALRGR